MIGKSIMLVLVAVVATAFITRERADASAKKFCAYGRVFVEFSEGSKTWGTILLDWEGNPIPCREKPEPAVSQHLNI